ncbi:hypothetical protein N7465_009214 [Penicillium sp. CMV-2018d]|nr:hypothetical protein N7465_009214 [Penicillium sp. CMV-2018d]
MAQQPNATQPLGVFNLSNLPQDLVLSIASILPARDRCRLCQTCKPLYSLLAGDIMRRRQLNAQILAPKEEYETHEWEWRTPYAIPGIDIPNKLKKGRFVVALKPNKSEILACAIERGDIEIVRKYLHSGVDPNVHSTTGGFMLHVAVEAIQPGMVTLLLEYGANPYSLHIRDRTTLYSLALDFDSHPELIVAFASGGNIDCFANYITRRCTYEAMQGCIDAGIDLNQTSSKGETVAHALARLNDLGMFRIVVPDLTMATLTKVSKMHETPLDVAMKQSSRDLAMEFIDAGADINHSIGSTVFTALETGRFEILDCCVDCLHP